MEPGLIAVIEHEVPVAAVPAVSEGTAGSLSLRGVTRRYAGGPAVDQVSFAIAAGEFVTLLGPSGSGKTTTLKMIAGFELPDAGSIHLGERDITRLAPNHRDIGMVFQNYALFPHMTVFENIAFPLRMRRRPGAEIAAAVERMLAMLQLGGLERRHPNQLSGGQQQRVALARALVFEPRVLLMDEPLGALDQQLRRQVQSEIKRLHRTLGVTIVFVTHDQEEAMFLSDRIAVMAAGRIVQEGSPARLYTAPVNRFVAAFVGASNFLAGRVERLDDGLPRIRLADGTILTGRAAGPLDPGQPVEALIRPERIGLEPAAGVPSIPGTVELASFLGGIVELEVGTAVGRVMVRAGAGSGVQGIAAGDAVHLSWRPEDLLVFGAAAGSP